MERKTSEDDTALTSTFHGAVDKTKESTHARLSANGYSLTVLLGEPSNHPPLLIRPGNMRIAYRE